MTGYEPAAPEHVIRPCDAGPYELTMTVTKTNGNVFTKLFVFDVKELPECDFGCSCDADGTTPSPTPYEPLVTLYNDASCLDPYVHFVIKRRPL